MNNTFKFGEGKLSGYSAIFLSILSLLGVFCFQFPESLTSPEFRNIYTGESMKIVLFAVIIASFFFAVLSFMLSKRKHWALIAIGVSVLTIVLGGFNVEGRAVEKTNWHLGLDWLLLDLLLMAIIFVPIEYVWPKNLNQTKFHPEWKTDLIYFVVSHLFIQFFGAITQKPAILLFGGMGLTSLHQWMNGLPFMVELFLAFFIADFFQYWTHRFFHSHAFLWRFHSVHHSTVHMDWLAGSRTHFVDIFVTRSMAFIPLYVFGFSPVVFNTYIVFMAVHAVLIHANTRINFGILKYIIATPQYHHWHHCEDPKYYGKNFATIFPFIDKIFGTYYLPGKVWPEGTGLHEANYPKGYVKQLIYPFQKSPFDNNLNQEERSER